MDIDRTSDGTDADTETTEAQPDQRPAPPVDRPGTDGYASRAESRQGAAAANETGTGTSQTGEEIHRQEDAVGKPESGRRAENASGTESTEQRDQSPGSANIPYDATTLAEADVRSAPGDSPGPSEDAGAPDASVPEGGHQTDGSDPGDTSGTLVAVPDVRQPSSESDVASGDVGPSSIPDAPDESVASVDRSSEPEAVSAGDTEVDNRGDTETAPESFTMALDHEDRSEEAQQEAGPWKYDLSVQDVPLEEFLDRTAGDYRRSDERNAAADDLPDEGPDWVERRSDLPGGEELRDMDSDKLSRFDKMRKSAFKKADDILDNSKEYINSGHDAFGRPPIGSHMQVRQAGPEFTDAAHHSATVGDLMTGVLVAGFLLGEGGRHIYRELVRKGDDHGGHR